ncbi:BlaI/MecI/CopY family transcriptional regulator [Streptomyces sp. NPDC058657]|uniref:BlaI/MecI/CopY family transcriptional regulator n=1 Tax=unclassified Streptomyces TaxID=2593676 RepID=UPI003646EFE7
MTRVWQWNRPVTVREVLEDLQKDRSIAYTTVMTVMDNLHQKGWVRREVDGRAYRYTSVSTRAAYSAALMNEAWSTSDNPAAALVAFFGMMSAEQRVALHDAMRVVRSDTSEEAEVPVEAPPEGRDEVRDEDRDEVRDEDRAGAPPEDRDEDRHEAAGEAAGEVPDEVPGDGGNAPGR